MNKWSVELSYGIGFTVSDIRAETREEAIEKAKHLVENGTTILPFDNSVDESGLKFDSVSYVQMDNTI